jgi:hypothetical protein
MGRGAKSKAQGRQFQILGNEHPVFRYPNFDYGDMQDVNRKKKNVRTDDEKPHDFASWNATFVAASTPSTGYPLEICYIAIENGHL